MSVVSSITMMAAEPSIVPAATSASKLACVSSLSGRITLTDDPPGMIALIWRSLRMPPA